MTTDLPPNDPAAANLAEPPLPELTGETGAAKPDRVAGFALGAAVTCGAVFVLAVGLALTGRTITMSLALLALSAPLQGMALIAGLLRWKRPQGKVAVAVILSIWATVVFASLFL